MDSLFSRLSVVTLSSMLLLGGLVAMTTSVSASPADQWPLLVTDWTPSYTLYGQPHAIWLSGYTEVGVNLPELQQALSVASERYQQPEVVVYSIPERDMGQSSAGGFKTEAEYWADNQLVAEAIQNFVRKTGIAPRVYLEPDALGHTLTLLRKATGSGDPQKNYDARTLYRQRVRLLKGLVTLYQQAGAWVYLDAAHSGWFDYSDADVQSMAQILKECEVSQAHGLVFNISNRQKVGNGSVPQTEAHYADRLIKALERLSVTPQKISAWDTVVDTSRNGGETHTRVYYLATDGGLFDNEWGDATASNARYVGQWQVVDTDIQLQTLTGSPKWLRPIVEKDDYRWDEANHLLTAPPWLDPVGDVQPGPAPTAETGIPAVSCYRFIKPPDDCDGSLHCPPGASKSIINQTIHAQQPSRSL